MSERGVAGERFAFDDDVWADEVERFEARSSARASAITARREIEGGAAPIAVRARDPEGADGTSLSGCAKVYVPLGVPPSRAPHGFVFEIVRDREKGVILRLLAYGERHPERGRSVYARAHRRLHGRYPDQ